MAAVGQSLFQQSQNVEARIKTLINNDLKAICRAYNLAVSGTKAALQQRCINLLKDLVGKGDEPHFNQLKARVANHGILPAAAATAEPSHGNQTNSMGQIVSRPQQSPALHLRFKENPFYEKVQTVLRAQELPEMPQNRHTVRHNLTLTDDQVRRYLQEPDTYRLMLYCAQSSLSNYTALDVAFPNQIEVKVNDDDVKSNFKGLKNKPGSTKPADITKMVRIRPNYANKLSICYALTTRRFAFTVILVKYVSADALVQKIRSANVIPKQSVLIEMARLNADPDIATTSSKMSLKDPISTLRITVPIRSTICRHNQCFDASMYMQLQEQAPTWICPVCAKILSFQSLAVDTYFEEILNASPAAIEQVTVDPDGSWRIVKEDEQKSMSNTAKGGARASYDDDFDDDIVEVDPAKSAVDEQKREWSSVASHAFNTPPLSSREPSVAQSASVAPSTGSKRTSNVIDLTLSEEDEDEPPRPAKRILTSAATANPSRPYQTPTSLPDRRQETNANSGSNTAPSRLHLPHPSASAGFASSSSLSRTNGALQSPINLSPYTAHANPPVFGRPSIPPMKSSSHFTPSNEVTPPPWGFRSPSAPNLAPSESPPQPSESQSPPRWVSMSAAGAQSQRQHDDARSWQSYSATGQSARLPPPNIPNPFASAQPRPSSNDFSSDASYGSPRRGSGNWQPSGDL